MTEGSLYLMPDIKGASASAQVDASGGMHAAFVHFVPLAENPAAVYSAVHQRVIVAAMRVTGNPYNWATVPSRCNSRSPPRGCLVC